MKVLIYGAGVLGGYLAYELSTAGHDVTVLARGKRFESLSKEGLVIEHHLQKKTTVSRVHVTESLGDTDEYDAVFVVMQRTQIDAVLPSLAANKKCRLYILIGNNGEAEKTQLDFTSAAKAEPTLLFGFLGVGGRREGDKVISVHKRWMNLTIGEIAGSSDYKDLVSKLLEGSGIRPRFSANINAWLKYHLALVLPLACAIHSTGGDMKKLSKSKSMLISAITAVKEGFLMLERAGYPPEPESMVKAFRKPVWVLLILLKPAVKTKAFKLAAVEHAMAAVGEMNRLMEELMTIKDRSGMETPCLDKMEGYLIKE